MSLGNLKGIKEFVERVGLPVALVVFFVWQWSIDKERMYERIDQSETYVRRLTENQLAENTKVIQANTEVMRASNEIMLRLEHQLNVAANER